MTRLKPISPGKLLLHEFLLPMGISQSRLAKEIGVPAQRIGEIVAGRGVQDGARGIDHHAGAAGRLILLSNRKTFLFCIYLACPTTQRMTQ